MAGRMAGGMKRENDDSEDLKDEEMHFGHCEKCGQSPLGGKVSNPHAVTSILLTSSGTLLNTLLSTSKLSLLTQSTYPSRTP